MIDADILLGLQQAYADLSKLADDAGRLTELRPWIENELTAKLFELGRRLRRMQWTLPAEQVVGELAQEVHDLQAQIRQRAEAVCTTTLFRAARTAFQNRDFPLLEELLPRLFADLEARHRPPQLLIPFDPSGPRRRPGQPPFLSPRETAAALEKIFREGLVLQAPESPPWVAGFPYVLAASNAEILASPIWLVCDAPTLWAAVLVDTSEPGAWRIYADVLRRFSAVGIAESVEDEWWLVQDRPFSEYRAELATALRTVGIECLPAGPAGKVN
ncbi:MAG: hypothetical protein KatS3mg077_0445 [Candidatus Binatia bacterium]|nr:MAG: hypothetical protein KatS3mg077_0445 [Candidatus Binatia bacterium]